MLVIMAILVALVSVVWLGLHSRPQSFPTFRSDSFGVKTIPLAKDLPAPAERFYRQLYDEDVPVIQSAVISGRGQLRIKGITFPARFRFTHRTGKDYRHYIETTLFGFPIMKVNEHFLDGVSRLELPFGVSEGPKVDQGANLALWAEAVWMPSLWITDSKVRWEARDEHSAFLIVPFKETEERFTVSFDPQTGLLKSLESMRYKEADSAEKTLWKNEVLEWRELDGYMIPVETAVTWADEGSPWAVFSTEDVIYNVDVDKYIRMKGPDE
jgi:hypothetical protein